MYLYILMIFIYFKDMFGMGLILTIIYDSNPKCFFIEVYKGGTFISSAFKLGSKRYTF